MITFIFFLTWIASSVSLYVFVDNSWYFITVWLLLGFIAGIVVLFLILLLFMPIMKFTKPNTKLKYILVKSMSRFLNNVVVNVSIKAKGTENIPKTGNLTIYGNHKSMIDPFVIMHHMNRAMGFTPKISLYKIPFLSNYMNYIGCLPIDREDNRKTAKTLINAIKNVKDGLAMAIFPEGGIISRDNDKMVSMKPGAFKIGQKAESDFLPVSIINNSKVSKKDYFNRIKITVIYHKVVKYETIKNLTTSEISDMMFRIINEPLR